MSTAPNPPRLPRRPDARPGQQATFYFEDGRCLEIRVPGAVALSCTSTGDHAGVCRLHDAQGALLGEVEGFAELLSARTS